MTSSDSRLATRQTSNQHSGSTPSVWFCSFAIHLLNVFVIVIIIDVDSTKYTIQPQQLSTKWTAPDFCPQMSKVPMHCLQRTCCQATVCLFWSALLSLVQQTLFVVMSLLLRCFESCLALGILQHRERFKFRNTFRRAYCKQTYHKRYFSVTRRVDFSLASVYLLSYVKLNFDL